MKQPNDMVQQMDILGPFYISNSGERNYIIISCLDDCSRRKVVSRWWSERKKRSADILNVLEDWIMMMVNGKPDRVMHHDNGKQFVYI
jgi:hypothetical protein